jgi:alkanesulfonate monooxygenase SsuD/methylene tetrahydromethanopterin reductase-like flavin-dependent oxidoreductase (luciferase family)
MDLAKKGVFCFTDALNPAQLIELAQRTEQQGYSALWYRRRLLMNPLPSAPSCWPIQKI